MMHKAKGRMIERMKVLGVHPNRELLKVSLELFNKARKMRMLQGHTKRRTNPEDHFIFYASKIVEIPVPGQLLVERRGQPFNMKFLQKIKIVVNELGFEIRDFPFERYATITIEFSIKDDRLKTEIMKIAKSTILHKRMNPIHLLSGIIYIASRRVMNPYTVEECVAVVSNSVCSAKKKIYKIVKMILNECRRNIVSGK